ncbi:MAG: glycosyltransferase family 39 protein [Candidatus Latescibacterota bacterium]|jgi:4-amino-4-deoxy-L-arabinose transferase-like glycosyltransferase
MSMPVILSGLFRHRALLGLILVAALGLRLGLALARPQEGEAADEGHWDRMARVFADQGLLAAEAGTYRPPLYPLMLAAIYRVCGTGFWPVRLVQAGLGVLTCLLIYHLGRRLGTSRTGLLAAALAAGYPLLVFFAGVRLAEGLIVLLAMVVLLQDTRFAARPTLGNATLLGAALGLAGLARPVLLAWGPLLIAGWWRRSDLTPRAWLGRTAAVVAGTVLVLAPWTLRNAVVTGRLVPVSTNAGINLLIGHQPTASGAYQDTVDYQRLYDRLVEPETDPVLRDQLAVRRVIGWIAREPGRAVLLGLRKLVLLWNPWIAGESAGRNALAVATSGPLLVLGGIGLWQTRSRPGAWGILSLILCLSAVHALFFAHTRFRLPADAALMAPAAWVLERLWAGWRRVA